MTPASIRVQVGDGDIHEINPDAVLMEMQVTHEVNQHSTCFLAFRQPPDQVFDLTRFHGIFIKVFAVLANGTEFPIFEGTIENASLKHQISAAVQLFLTAFGDTKFLDHQNRFQTYKFGSLLEKMKDIMNRSVTPLEAAVLVNNPNAVQFITRSYQLGETDWIHLLAEAGDHGLMLVPDASNLFAMDHFQPTDTNLRLNQEGGLIAFEVRTQFIPAMRRGINYDPSEFKSRIFGEIEDADSVPILKAGGGLNSLLEHSKKRNVVDFDQGARSEVSIVAEGIAELRLKADSRRAFGQSVRGIGASREAALLLGRGVTIQGSDSFDGAWGIIRLVHTFSPSTGYVNEFECTPFDSGECVPAVEVPAVHSLFRGRVISVPVKATGRIQVQFPWEETGDNSLFWPWLAPSAGADRGFCFPPEVGDEVVVQFHDESTAFIICAAWNEKELPPLQDLHGKEVDNNDIKRLVTKSGNRLVMDDKQGKETIVVATPKHVRVSLFDGGSTLVLHSDGDIHINAGGTVHMKCHQFLREDV
jgi:type VI secretion system secreted protein VgrG